MIQCPRLPAAEASDQDEAVIEAMDRSDRAQALDGRHSLSGHDLALVVCEEPRGAPNGVLRLCYHCYLDENERKELIRFHAVPLGTPAQA
jgi:hypothetical protein